MRPNAFGFMVGDSVSSLEPFDGLLSSISQRLHNGLRSVIGQRGIAFHRVEERDVKPHDTESNNAKFSYFIDHKSACQDSTAAGIP